MPDDRPRPPPPGGPAPADDAHGPEPLALGDFRLLAKVGGGTQGGVRAVRAGFLVGRVRGMLAA